MIAKQANKRGRKREKRMEKAVAALKVLCMLKFVCVCVCACECCLLYLQKHRSKQRVKSSGNFSALYLINDPQGTCI